MAKERRFPPQMPDGDTMAEARQLIGLDPRLTPRQELFVHEYLVDMDQGAAYLRAGYECDPENAARCANSLMRNAGVLDAINRAQLERLRRTEIDGDWTVAAFKLLYLKAEESRDWGAACQALVQIGKFLGIFERDNRQKHYSESDADKLRAELAQAGFDMGRTNYPVLESQVKVAPNEPSSN